MNQGARNTYGRYVDVKNKGVECVYDLTEKPLLFLDLGLIYPGIIVWKDRGGAPHPLHATVEYYGDTKLKKEDVVGVGYRAPSGISFEAQPAIRGPETDHGSGTLIHEDGVYRLWEGHRLGKEFKEQKIGDESKGFDLQSINSALHYFESDDGVTWRSPEFDFCKLNGRKTNILYGSWTTPKQIKGFSGMSIFKDPSAPPEERYKGMYASSWPLSTLAEFCRKEGLAFDPMNLLVKLSRLTPKDFSSEKQYYDAVVKGILQDDLAGLPESETMLFFGAVSPDGLKWTGLEKPVMTFMAEAGKPFYDVEKEKYVNYIRYWQYAQRRSIGISETDDFHRWPQPRPLLSPSLDETPGTDFYTNSHTLYPGTTDVHLFFVSKFHHGTNDCVDLHLAVSLDGDLINFVPGGPIVPCDTENWDPDKSDPASCVFPGHGMAPFGTEHVGIIVNENNVPHKWPRTVQRTNDKHWALWEKDRLVALRARGKGEFTTAGLVLTKPNIFVNAKTEPPGVIRARLMDDQYQPVAGFGLSDSDPINGDHPRAPLTWGGKPVPSQFVGKKIYLDFDLLRSRLFSISAGE